MRWLKMWWQRLRYGYYADVSGSFHYRLVKIREERESDEYTWKVRTYWRIQRFGGVEFVTRKTLPLGYTIFNDYIEDM